MRVTPKGGGAKQVARSPPLKHTTGALIGAERSSIVKSH